MIAYSWRFKWVHRRTLNDKHKCTTTEVSQTLQLESLTLCESSIEWPNSLRRVSGYQIINKIQLNFGSSIVRELLRFGFRLLRSRRGGESSIRVSPSETRSAKEYRNHRGHSGWGTACPPTFLSTPQSIRAYEYTVSIFHLSVYSRVRGQERRKSGRHLLSLSAHFLRPLAHRQAIRQ